MNQLCKQYLAAENYLNQGLIRNSVSDVPKKYIRREWMLRFLEDLGHPEKNYPCIHIAGTSGKGSTAVMIAEILRQAGYKTGLHITPYLQVATEKLWFEGKYASAEEFIDLIEWVKPICEKWRSPEVPLHGMTSFGLCLEYFRRKKVDIAVIETGVGGRNDLTNVLNTCLAVITPLGFDHTKTLGDTIESIAGHKAGIMRKNIPVVVFRGRGSDVILAYARQIGAALKWVEPEDTGFPLSLKMKGGFQHTNARIAEKAALTLQELGYHINETDISAGLTQARIPGRLEKLQSHPEVIIDGAHNYQKLNNLFLEFSGRRIIVIYGMLQSKINDRVLGLLKRVNARFIFTKPEVYGKEAFDPHPIIARFPPGEASLFPSPSDALQEAVKIGGKRAVIVVAGSLYLAGNIRESYFPAEDVLFSRTSWPNMSHSVNNSGCDLA